MYLIFVLYALFGSIFTAAKIGLDHAQPFFLVGSRMLFAGVLIWLYLFFFKRDKLEIKKGHGIKLFLLGLFNIYLTNGFEFWGMKYLTSSKTCFIYSLTPFFAAILSFIFLKERLGWKKILGLLIGFIGFIPILADSTHGEVDLLSFGFLSLAELAVMLAAISTVYGWIVMRQLVTENMEPLVANAFSMMIGGTLALIHSLGVETWNPVPVFGEWSAFWESMIWMVIVSSLICYNLYGYLLKRFTVTFMSFAGFTTPFFVALFSWFMIGESLSNSFYASAVVVLIGLILFNMEELKKDGIKKKEAC